MSELVKFILMIAFIVFLVVIGPLLTIWAMNTLFPVLAIPVGIETWAAIVLLGGFFRANISVKK